MPGGIPEGFGAGAIGLWLGSGEARGGPRNKQGAISDSAPLEEREIKVIIGTCPSLGSNLSDCEREDRQDFPANSYKAGGCTNRMRTSAQGWRVGRG